jgi:hypothetical protein
MSVWVLHTYVLLLCVCVANTTVVCPQTHFFNASYSELLAKLEAPRNRQEQKIVLSPVKPDLQAPRECTHTACVSAQREMLSLRQSFAALQQVCAQVCIAR